MEKETARPLQKMFMAVPPAYDLLNRLLTFRFDERWRKRAAGSILAGQPERVLDLCTGTGDLALHLKKGAGANAGIWGLDYSIPMLERAKSKAVKRRLHGIDFIHGDVAAMPFPNEFFDAIGIAFAFRNLTYKNPDTGKFLAEIIRVMKNGGKFVVVETSQPGNRLFRALVHFYLKRITVPVGGLISGQRGAYHYLAHSAVNYYSAEQVRQLLLEAGFSRVEYRLLLKGVAGIWEAIK
jgi:demethylmenaquinone methyltransferase / 2-methoxy-6-polyprenyl-1,4-benzoquinol methylase